MEIGKLMSSPAERLRYGIRYTLSDCLHCLVRQCLGGSFAIQDDNSWMSESTSALEFGVTRGVA